ncbi:efflux RND transporter periplasmic adaptor subunit [Mucilaginibacter sp. L196]|uniref:efflux RND transporter periplasmic adaptor subunit n=1 Tax=Mucilaginibacter sp. L196 TaxID=1641870 RepID=UPI00131DDF18|nr:efflux RND transporter periplasmic adaptor subunit [Mucilaginibacter sp. L196]
MNIQKNKLIIVVTALVIGTVLFSSCGESKKDKEEQDLTVQQENALDTPTVSLVAVNKGKLSSNITVPGELQAYQQTDLYAKVNSYVKTLLVDIGSQVHQGQLLAMLEAPELNSQLEEAKSRIQQAKAVYFASKATFDRLYSTSKTPGTVSENDLEQAQAKKSSDSASVEAAKSSYQSFAANLGYLQIRAPFDGVITLRNVNLGAYVGPGGAASNQALFRLEDHNRLRLVISVPENFTGGLHNGDEVSFVIRELRGEKFTAKVVRLAGALDNTLRSERLEMDVYNTSKKLLPNMYADVNVPLVQSDSAFIVPKTAVVTSTEKVFVIRVKDGKAEWLGVQKGLESGDNIEIYGKIDAGDQIVKAATEEIRDGSPIKIGSGDQTGIAKPEKADTSKTKK